MEKEIPFMKLSTNSTKSFSKCEVTFMSQQKRLKTKRFTNGCRMCLFQSFLLNKALETTDSNREDTTISLIRAGRDAQVLNSFARQKSLEPLAASSEWQSHVPKFGADGPAWSNKIHRLVTPRKILYSIRYNTRHNRLGLYALLLFFAS